LKQISFNSKRDTYLKCPDLDAGEYAIICEVNWNPGTKDKSFVLTCYGLTEIEFKDVSGKFDSKSLVMPQLVKNKIFK
jgi:hypothetical protein